MQACVAFIHVKMEGVTDKITNSSQRIKKKHAPKYYMQNK